MSALAHDRPAPTTERKRACSDAARPLLYFVYSPTSGPSRRAEGFLAQVLQRRQNHRAFVVQRVDCVERPDLAKKLGAKTVPSLVVVESRRVRARLEGVTGCKQIEQLLAPWLERSEDESSGFDDEDTEEPGVVRLVATDSIESFDRVAIGLPPDLTFEGWRAVGKRISGVADASTWWLADWAAYGEDRFGERYQDAAAITGVGYQTLRNYAWVARRFDVSRRRDKLSFAHHSEVAALSASRQETWLDRAEAQRWSRNELRAALRAARSLAGGEDRSAEVEHVRLAVASARVERWRTAAGASGLGLPDWLISVADRASA